MNKIIVLMLGILLISFANATTLGTFKQNECINLIQTCANCTYVNISSVLYPNTTLIISDKEMTQLGTYFYYNFCNTTELETYQVTGVGNPDGINTVWNYDFTITPNGRETPSNGITLFFIIIFIITCAFVCFISLYSLGHFLTLDFDMVDLSIDIGLFIGLVAVYYTETYYLGSVAMDNWFLLLIKIGVVLLVLLPIFAFFLSITIGSINKQGANVGKPAIIRWRRG
jgi:hypothetical protein